MPAANWLFFTTARAPTGTGVALAPKQADVQRILRNFLLAILPTGIEVFQGQDNRVPEPQSADFVVFTAINRVRLETNIDATSDCFFTGSISGDVLTVSAVSYGTIEDGAPLFGPSVSPGTFIQEGITGDGGIGTYQLTKSMTVASGPMAAGLSDITQPTDVIFQLDVHGPNSADNAQIISTLFRDQYGTAFFAQSGYDMAPLYTDDPKQIPFINDQQQYETRWVMEAHVQANQVVTVPQQFADVLQTQLINVEATFSP